MQATAIPAPRTPLSDADILDLVRDALARRAPSALQPILADWQAHPEIWSSEPGQMFLIELVSLVIEALTDGDTPFAADLLSACPVALIEKTHNLLLLAFFPDGHVGNLSALDDAALLCLAMLTHRMGHRTRAAELLDKAMERDLSNDLARTSFAIRHHFTATAKTRFKAKLIIWGHPDVMVEEQRAAFIRAFNERGIVSAICAEGDPDRAQARLEAVGLWDEIVFPRIGEQPRGAVVRQLIEDMLLVPANVLFIDGTAATREAVAAAAPGIRVANAADCDALLQQLLDQTSPVGASRIADYRILEARVADRQLLSDAEFLMQSGMQATYTHRMDNLDFVDRIEELINRADPLNYTETRVVPGTLRELIMNVTDYDIFSAFIWDKYGHHGLDGLVGVVVYDRRTRRPLHLAFSCRIMHMGVEDFLMKALTQRYGPIDLSALAKPLPAQSSAAITPVAFEEVRAQILAAQAPRDWSKIRMRIMSDCMSGGFHHYSRFKDEIDFDNIPRVFGLAAMLTGVHAQPNFPEFLVYNAPIDYMDWRWQGVMTEIDPIRYAQALDAFCNLVVTGRHKLLLFLSPEDAADQYYACLPNLSPQQLKARNKAFNQLWREAAARHPAQIAFVDLGDFVGEADMLRHAYHYAPSTLKQMTEIIDGWYAAGGRLAA